MIIVILNQNKWEQFGCQLDIRVSESWNFINLLEKWALWVLIGDK